VATWMRLVVENRAGRAPTSGYGGVRFGRPLRACLRRGRGSAGATRGPGAVVGAYSGGAVLQTPGCGSGSGAYRGAAMAARRRARCRRSGVHTQWQVMEPFIDASGWWRGDQPRLVGTDAGGVGGEPTRSDSGGGCG
jgi:hypothetical protein